MFTKSLEVLDGERGIERLRAHSLQFQAPNLHTLLDFCISKLLQSFSLQNESVLICFELETYVFVCFSDNSITFLYNSLSSECSSLG